MKNLALQIRPENSPTEHANSKITRALNDRLLPSEAFEAVGSMLTGYAHKGQADQNYIANFANILTRYPRSVAIKCAHPIDGAVKETQFLPTPADVIDWCEKASRPLREAAAREARIEAQLKAREEWNAAARAVPARKEITYKEHLELAAQGKTKVRPIGAFEPGGYLGPMNG